MQTMHPHFQISNAPSDVIYIDYSTRVVFFSMDGGTQSLRPHIPPLKRMRTIVMKSILVDQFIKDVKREIVFKDVTYEAKDRLHDLSSSEDIGKKSIRLASPPPDSNLPSELRKMSYRELNKQCLSSYSSGGSTSGSEGGAPTVRFLLQNQ